MLENASRQLFLVLLTLIAGVFCIATLEIPYGPDLRGGSQLRYEVPQDVLDQLTQKENASLDAIMEQSIAVISDRIDPTGTLDALVTRSGPTGILVELPYFQDPLELGRVEQRIANLGKLEMRIVADGDYARPAADGKPPIKFNLAAEAQKLKTWLEQPANKELIQKDARNIRRFNDDVQNGPSPFGALAWYPRKITADPKRPSAWAYTFSQIPTTQAATVKFYADADYNNGLIPESYQQKPEAERFLVEFLALNMHERSFSGEDLDASGTTAGTSRDGGLAVNYKIVGDKAGDYAQWSDDYTNKSSAIVLNGFVKSAPRFEGRIPGYGQITGDFSRAEVEELVKVLRTGSLRVEPELQSRLVIGPTLGQESIQRGLLSLVAGAGLVFLFMLWYYRLPGIIACITLVLNVTLLYAAMKFMQATLTLPGLGGIVLTLGMAVDANVLIYERIREELQKGKELLQATRAGFERAMSAILDSNITTFLVGMVLYNVGVGTVRGFAVTLMIGIVTTVFTQVFVTRLLFHYALETGRFKSYAPRSLFAGINLDYVKWMRPCLTASIAVIVVGLGYVLFAVPNEVKLGLDFTGGANLQMVMSQPLAADQVKARLRDDAQFNQEYPNVTVNTVGKLDAQQRAAQFNVRLKLNDRQRQELDAARKAWRESRQAAEKAGQAPPAAFEPPYVQQLRRIFAEQLVKPAFSDPQLTPSVEANLAFAQLDLHFQKEVEVATAAQKLAEKQVASVKVLPLGTAEGATAAKDLRIEWLTPSTTRPWELFEFLRNNLEGLNGVDGSPVTLSDPFPEAQEIQGRLVNDLRNAAIGALILSWGLIVLYLRVRFHEYRYGIAAVVALVHDVLVALIAVVVANQLGLVHAEINLAMIAAFLTIIGYSVNDTIVIFDRIRENLTENQKLGVVAPFRGLINHALNQTMSRTLLTSGVTLFVVIAQFAVNWGSESDLEGFAFAMIVGMVAGVYSTIFIAAPILITMHKDHAPAAPAAAVPATATPPAP